MLCKQAALVALLLPLAAAAACNDASLCSELIDETSLVQVHRTLKPGGERTVPDSADAELLASPKAEGTKQEWFDDIDINPDTPVHDAYAISDAFPGHLDVGEVRDAFDANLAKVKDELTKKNAESLEFENMLHQERKANYRAAEQKIKKDGFDLKRAYEADRLSIDKVRSDRDKKKAESKERVAQAKEDADAHDYKKYQTEQAALAGRTAGEYEAEQSEQYAREDMYDSWKKQYLKERRQRQKDDLSKDHAEDEAEARQETAEMAGEEKAWVKQADKDKRTEEADMQADASLEETEISGPEALDNHIDEELADVEVKDRSRATFQDQGRIDHAAKASWPHGHYPYRP